MVRRDRLDTNSAHLQPRTQRNHDRPAALTPERLDGTPTARRTPPHPVDAVVCDDDLLRSNPVRDAEMIARPRDGEVDEIVVFDCGQADALADWCLRNLEGEPWALPVLIGLDCGLRRGEILAVKTTMIDEQTNRLRVNTGITEEAGMLVDKRLKTKRSRRTVVIPDRTIAAVKRYRQHHCVTPINGLLIAWRDGDSPTPTR